MTPAIETPRLRLTPVRADDAAEMVSVLADETLYTFIGASPPTAADLEATYRRWLVGPPRAAEAWHNWVIRLAPAGTAIGHAQATVTEDGSAADIGWLVGVTWQGQGYASEAASAVARWLEADGVATITAHVNPDHLASARVAERAGLTATDELVDGEVVWRREIRSS